VAGTKEGGAVFVAFQMHRKAAPLFEMEQETWSAIDEMMEESLMPCRGRYAAPSGKPSCSRGVGCNDEATGAMQHGGVSSTSLRAGSSQGAEPRDLDSS
jgi:hypothetical protein